MTCASPYFIGIDVSCDFFHAAIPDRRPRLFEASFRGVRELLSWVRRDCPDLPIRAVMEHTGVYTWKLKQLLDGAGIESSLINPARIRYWAFGEGFRSKTDSQDALAILGWAQYHKPALTRMPPEAQHRVDNLMRGRDELIRMRVSAGNRLKTMQQVPELYGELLSIWEGIADKLRECEDQIDELIRVTIAEDATLNRAQAVLSGVKSIGPVATGMLCSMLERVLDCSEKQLTALAGLAPRDWSSGRTVRGKPRIDKMGIPRIRRIMYFAAISALRHDPAMREFSQTMKERGKPGKVIVVAVARKLLLKAQRALKEEFRDQIPAFPA